MTDTPDMAAAYETATFPGDLIMLATDGYTDNVFSESTLSMCTVALARATLARTLRGLPPASILVRPAAYSRQFRSLFWTISHAFQKLPPPLQSRRVTYVVCSYFVRMLIGC